VKLGIVGGTALEELALEQRQSLAVATPWGDPSGPLHCGRLAGAEVCYLNRHGDDHLIPPHGINYRANVWALHQQKVDCVIAVSAVGGITAEMVPGALVIPHQIIDYSWGRQHSYSEGGGTELRHVDFTQPYDDDVRVRLSAASSDCGVSVVDHGVYGVTQGPRLETAAEVARMARDGCDLVGMTGMPEAGLARELAIPYACLALVVNPAAGKCRREITMADISAVMAQALPEVISVLVAFCRGR
jgi:5'-methylthioinosine phosphorylase